MNYAFEMSSGSMKYVPCIIKINSAIEKLLWVGGGGYTCRHTDSKVIS
jgi:hypothetical protein